jgi:hypothetical protein
VKTEEKEIGVTGNAENSWKILIFLGASPTLKYLLRSGQNLTDFENCLTGFQSHRYKKILGKF